MINETMRGLGTKRSVIREIFEYGNKRRAEIGAENVFDFSLGNPSVPAPEKVGRVMKRLLEECDPVSLHGYTSAAGDPAVRKAVADSICHRFAVTAKADDIYMTCGAAASLTISLHAILNTGDEVIVPAPFFPEYTVFIEKAGGRQVTLPCPTFRPEPQALAAALTPRTKAVLLNYPNNPSGVTLDADEIAAIARVLREKQQEYGTTIYIIADEPYRELVYGKDVPYIPRFYENTIVCYSFSKSLSLPGERIGYIFVPSFAAEADAVFAAVCGAGRALGFVCAPSLLQKTVARCLDERPDLEAYDRNRRTLYDGLRALGLQVAPPDGAFYLFVKAPNGDAEAFCERAKKYELLLVSGAGFGAPDYVRISYCVSYEQIVRSLPAFAGLMAEYKE